MKRRANELDGLAPNQEKSHYAWRVWTAKEVLRLIRIGEMNPEPKLIEWAEKVMRQHTGREHAE